MWGRGRLGGLSSLLSGFSLAPDAQASHSAKVSEQRLWNERETSVGLLASWRRSLGPLIAAPRKAKAQCCLSCGFLKTG